MLHPRDLRRTFSPSPQRPLLTQGGRPGAHHHARRRLDRSGLHRENRRRPIRGRRSYHARPIAAAASASSWASRAMRHDIILFDLDGTLTTIQPDIRGRAVRLRAFGIELFRADCRSSSAPLSETAVCLEILDAAVARSADTISRAPARRSPTQRFPRCRCLQKQGQNLFVATSGSDIMAGSCILEHFGLAPSPDAICGARERQGSGEKVNHQSRSGSRRDDHRLIMIGGDRRHFNVIGAHLAKLDVISVLCASTCRRTHRRQR